MNDLADITIAPVRSSKRVRRILGWSVAYSERLDAAKFKPSTGAVSFVVSLPARVRDRVLQDRVDQAAPAVEGFDDLEIATAEWVDWFNPTAVRSSTATTSRPSRQRPLTTLTP